MELLFRKAVLHNMLCWEKSFACLLAVCQRVSDFWTFFQSRMESGDFLGSCWLKYLKLMKHYLLHLELKLHLKKTYE